MHVQDGNDVSRDMLAGAVREVAERVGDNRDRQSVVLPADKIISRRRDGETLSGVPKGVFAVGDGKPSDKAVLVANPGVVDVTVLGYNSGALKDQGVPARPRRLTAAAKTTSGIPGERMSVTLTWAPPLLDTSGRWMQNMYYDELNQLQLQDAVSTYTVTRHNVGTGEATTIAVVAHSEQYISEIRNYLETEELVVTDPVTLQTTFDPSLWVDVLDGQGEVLYRELQIPGGHDAYFVFTDNAAIAGQQYNYIVQATNADQVESAPVSADPGEAVTTGNMDVQFDPGWVSTFPAVDGSETTAYADISATVGGVVTSLEIGVIPIAPNILVIEHIPSVTDPIISYTNPDQVKLPIPATADCISTICFRAENIEVNGGVSSITFRAGITANALPGALTKTRVETTDEWDYRLLVTVAPTATPGPVTMTVTTLSGKTAVCSAIEVVAPTGTEDDGATFESPGYTQKTYLHSGNIMLDGFNMDVIHRFHVTLGGVTKGLYVPTALTRNQAAFDYDLAGHGTYKVTATYLPGRVSTGNDHFYLFLCEDPPPPRTKYVKRKISTPTVKERGGNDRR